MLAMLGCGGSTVSRPPVDPTAGEVGAIGLAFQAPRVLDLPASSRPWAETPKRWRVRGKWKQTRVESGRAEYAVRAPHRLTFYGQQGGAKPRGMRLELKPGGKMRFAQQKKTIGPVGTWGLRKNQLIIRVPESEGLPEKVWVRVPGATKAERSMNMDTAERSAQDFAFRTMDRREYRSHGLFLPAPGRVQWQLEVPRNGRLDLDAELLTPPVRTQRVSDGAVVVVTVDAGAGPIEVLREALAPGKRRSLSASLAPWAGKALTLQIQTEPGENQELDYVFLADPVLHTPRERPARALLLFVDTLRRDHLGLYGYARPSSPVIDQLAQASVVYERAWAPSPWTLPSALAALYGRAPEIIQGHPHLGEQLGAEGWATCAVVSNNWLTGPDTLGGGWSEHRARRGASAEDQAQRTRRCLERYPDRDTLLFVHFIDPHLPYMEAEAFQGRFAGDPPAGLPKRIRHSHAREAYAKAETAEDKAAIRRHLIDRYDQNILAVDAAVGTLLRWVGPDATVVLFSDHGEEFWEHGGFEHGHTLHDELVAVPLLIRSRALAPGRALAPATLMDIVPTLRTLLSLPPPAPWAGPGAAGQSLVESDRSDEGARTTRLARPIALGRILFGDDRWGVVQGDRKWVAAAGSESLYRLSQGQWASEDLEEGPNEWPGWLSRSLNRPVERVLRVVGPGSKRQMAGGKSELWIRHTAPIRAAWTRMDPHSSLADPVLTDGAVYVASSKGQKAPREVFVQLAEGADPAGLEVRWMHKRTEHVDTVRAKRGGGPLLRLGPPGAVLTVGWTWQPIPLPEGEVRYSGEVTEELRALGYVE